MKLKKIYFDAFKSLIDVELNIQHNCTGIVGINESGKSNILKAIRILNKEKNLQEAHIPKMNRKKNPKLRFDFELDSNEVNDVNLILNDWISTNSLINFNENNFDFLVSYEIEYDINNKKEKRNFQVKEIQSKAKDFLVLKQEFNSDKFKIFTKEETFLPLEEAIILNKDQINFNDQRIKEINKSLNDKKSEIEKFKKEKSKLSENETEKIKNLEEKISNLDQETNDYLKVLSEFNIELLKNQVEEKINSLKKSIEITEKDIESQKKIINKYKLITTPTPPQKSALTKAQNNLKVFTKNLIEKEKTLIHNKKILEGFSIPLKEKYSSDINKLDYYFSRILNEELDNKLPEVIFWKYSENFLLKPKTDFKSILSKNSLDEISRPLLNVFRIGLNIKTIQDLKENIKTIQEVEHERNKIGDKLNRKVNNHIKKVWSDYDQEIKISLEEHQIRIEFFDPKFDDRSYFNMQEKSQGAQTFISFLMTVGAEAASGVLKNKILLLDEPETHLHPSGVRYMLQELIKISNKNNIVLYATHSIFMIDSENYERHIYLKKKDEKTSINPSSKNRIGFFMQEEVLYGALDFNLNKNLPNKNKYNFVFEGESDTLLFKNYIENIKQPKFIKDIEESSFYPGGGCNRIRNYIKSNPIQLGTKWIFILDNDNPADNLKKFLESHYKEYLNKDIFIFQYQNSDKKEQNIELEDLIEPKFIKEIIKESSEKNQLDFTDDFPSLEDNSFENFLEEFISNNSFIDEEKEKLKITFKNLLNKKVEEEYKNKNSEIFKSDFKKYEEWTISIIEDLEKKIK